MDLVEHRLDICKKCPLYKKTVYGEICNPYLYIDKEDNTSRTYKEGFTKGCNCLLRRKASNPENHCIVNKW